ncbi:MAG: hypothetical protein OEQ53_11050 [Saprospiraceae bacterium]|nr:hypothetical protein [Saprospiraceae bacterium]
MKIILTFEVPPLYSAKANPSIYNLVEKYAGGMQIEFDDVEEVSCSEEL